MLTSKDILERTGISRATLNNYIASGLVPRPEVLPPGPDDGAAPRIGYFPEDTIRRIETIQRLKREGWSIARIAEHLGGAPLAEPAPAAAAAARTPPPMPPVAPAPPPPAVAVVREVRRTPVLTPVAMLVATLEDAAGLWIQLSAQEYFELVDQIWTELDAIFRARGGLPARHPDEGMVSCFLSQGGTGYLLEALAAAHEAREAMHRLTLRWQERKAWDQPLNMNTGVDAGEDWVGRLGAGELRVLGEASNRAEQLSRCAGGGAVLATRELLGKLTREQRERVTFGVPRGSGGEPHLLFTFARLADLGLPAVPPALADLAVAEVLEVRAPGALPTTTPL